MPSITSQPGDTVAAIASRLFNGDVSRFSEILDLNPSLDIFAELPQNLNLKIPDATQILNYAKPVLSEIGETIKTAETIITTVEDKLPSQLQGYAKEAINLLGEINGTRSQVETTLTKVGETARSYTGNNVKLVRWLLGGQA